MELPTLPNVETKVNPITKSESIKMTTEQYTEIQEVIKYQQTQITALEAHNEALSNEKKRLKLNMINWKKAYKQVKRGITGTERGIASTESRVAGYCSRGATVARRSIQTAIVREVLLLCSNKINAVAVDKLIQMLPISENEKNEIRKKLQDIKEAMREKNSRRLSIINR